MSCQTLGFPAVFNLKDLLYVPEALIHFHLDLVFRSLLHDLYLFQPILKVQFSDLRNASIFLQRTEGNASELSSWSSACQPPAKFCLQFVLPLHPMLVVTMWTTP